MATKVTKGDGTSAIIPDLAKSTIGGLSILGYRSANYTQDMATNLIRLGENFNSPSSPYNPLVGQTWHDSNRQMIKVCTTKATILDTQGLTTANDGSTWLPIIALDSPNSRSGLVMNNQSLWPTVSPTPQTLVVRDSTGKIDAASLPSNILASNASHATLADQAILANHATLADKATLADNATIANAANSLSPGSRINGLLYQGNNDITISTDQVPEGSRQYFTNARARQALSGGGSISYDPNTGLISADLSSAISGISAQVTSESITRANADGALAQSITTVTAAFTDGTGQGSLASAVGYLKAGADSGSSAASSVNDIKSQFISATGQSNFSGAVSTLWSTANSKQAISGWSLNLDSNGFATGIQALNGGASNNYIKFLTDNFILGNASSSAIPFEVVNGTVFMKSAVIQDLTLGTTKLAPNSISRTYSINDPNTYYGGVTYNLCSVTITLDYPATLYAIANAKQSYSNGTKNWTAYLYVDGAQASFAGGGTGFTDSMTTSCSVANMAPGTHTIVLRWYAQDSSVRLSNTTMYVQGIYK